MAIGKSSRAKIIFTTILLCTLSWSANAADHRAGIWKILREGKFSGAMNEDARLRPVGELVAGKRYYLMDFAWEESPKNMRADFPHAQYRLLVFERNGKDLRYLGSYVTKGGHPHIEGNTVVFPYKDYKVLEWKIAKTIVFDEKGPPPKAFLDGESFEFFR